MRIQIWHASLTIVFFSYVNTKKFATIKTWAVSLNSNCPLLFEGVDLCARIGNNLDFCLSSLSLTWNNTNPGFCHSEVMWNPIRLILRCALGLPQKQWKKKPAPPASKWISSRCFESVDSCLRCVFQKLDKGPAGAFSLRKLSTPFAKTLKCLCSRCWFFFLIFLSVLGPKSGTMTMNLSLLSILSLV